MALTVVIDGGGTGSRLAAFDTDGIKLAQVESTPANLTLGADTVHLAISSGLSQLAGKINKPNNWLPNTLWCGLAGSQQLSNREDLLQKFPQTTQCHIINDGHAQLLGCCKGVAPAACLAIGTGSVLNTIDEKGRHSTQGGWGFPAGDEASGAWLGLQAINHLTHWYDTRLKSSTPPPMIEALLDVVEPTVAGIQRYSTCKDPRLLASLAPIVFETAPQDTRALKIIQSGAAHLQDLIEETSQAMQLYLAGGLARSYQPYLMSISQRELKIAHSDAAIEGLYWLSNQHREIA